MSIKFLQYFNTWLSLKHLYFKLASLQTVFGGLAVILLVFGIIDGTYFAPLDYQQQEAYKIIYYHVPSAMLSLSIYATIGVSSIIYIIWRIKVYDLIAKVSVHIGAVFTIIALVSGSLWGRPMWGTWWIWDARLTSELILLFLYLGLIVMRQSFNNPQKAAFACALLACIGLIDLPIIHYSVYWWNTLHQQATLLKFAKPSIDQQMLFPLLMTIVGLYCFYFYLLIKNLRTEILWRERQHAWVRDANAW